MDITVATVLSASGCVKGLSGFLRKHPLIGEVEKPYPNSCRDQPVGPPWFERAELTVWMRRCKVVYFPSKAELFPPKALSIPESSQFNCKVWFPAVGNNIYCQPVGTTAPVAATSPSFLPSPSSPVYPHIAAILNSHDTSSVRERGF
jgi:hypothetical protein